jgi:Prp8 binding protein
MLTTTNYNNNNNNNPATSILSHPTIKLIIPNKQHSKRSKNNFFTTSTTTTSNTIIPVQGIRFSDSGEIIGTIHFDGQLHLWNCTGTIPLMGSCKIGNSSPLLQFCFYKRDCDVLVASSDSNSYIIDAETLQIKDVLTGHRSYCNGICSLSEYGLVCTSSDDCTVRIWDPRMHSPSQAHVIEFNYEATSVCSLTKSDFYLCSGNLDGGIRLHDIRRLNSSSSSNGIIVEEKRHHKELISGLHPHPDGKHVLSYALDGKLIMWDMQPFSATDRAILQFQHSPPLTNTSWSSDQSLLRCTMNSQGTRISCGSSSTSGFTVACYDKYGNPIFALPGHTGTVLETSFHPYENLIASCGMDGNVFVGEMPM